MIIETGILLWNMYCLRSDPNIQKPATYASALEYFIQQDILEDRSITQVQIAKEYGISAGTVSTNYRRLLYELDDLDISRLLEESVHESFVESSSLSPTNGMDSFNMEKEMRAIEKLLEGQNFESTEEINA